MEEWRKGGLSTGPDTRATGSLDAAPTGAGAVPVATRLTAGHVPHRPPRPFPLVSKTVLSQQQLGPGKADTSCGSSSSTKVVAGTMAASSLSSMKTNLEQKPMPIPAALRGTDRSLKDVRPDTAAIRQATPNKLSLSKLEGKPQIARARSTSSFASARASTAGLSATSAGSAAEPIVVDDDDDDNANPDPVASTSISRTSAKRSPAVPSSSGDRSRKCRRILVVDSDDDTPRDACPLMDFEALPDTSMTKVVGEPSEHPASRVMAPISGDSAPPTREESVLSALSDTSAPEQSGDVNTPQRRSTRQTALVAVKRTSQQYSLTPGIEEDEIDDETGEAALEDRSAGGETRNEDESINRPAVDPLRWTPPRSRRHAPTGDRCSFSSTKRRLSALSLGGDDSDSELSDIVDPNDPDATLVEEPHLEKVGGIPTHPASLAPPLNSTGITTKAAPTGKCVVLPEHQDCFRAHVENFRKWQPIVDKHGRERLVCDAGRMGWMLKVDRVSLIAANMKAGGKDRWSGN